jgi:hypothetical protein
MSSLRDTASRARLTGGQRRLGQAMAAVLGLGCAWCVTSPRSHSGVDAGANGSTITFTGIVAPGTKGTIAVQVHEPNGAWVTVGSAAAPSGGQWTVHANVPEADWSIPCSAATFRVLTQTDGGDSGALPGFDGPCLDDAGTLGADASGYWQTVSSCKTTLFAVHRAGAPVSGVVYHGNLAIKGQAQADLYQCIGTVDGNLTLEGDDAPINLSPDPREIKDSDGVNLHKDNALSLPNLVTVTGDMTVSLTSVIVPDPDRPSVLLLTNKLDTPNVTTIGGTLTLKTRDDASLPEGIKYEFGLDHLTSLKNLSFLQNLENKPMRGLRGLTTITGNLDADWRMGEIHLLPINPNDPTSGFLPSIAHVGGDFTFKVTGGNLNEMWPTLQTVGGNLTLSASFFYQPHAPGVLNGLTTVGGVLTIDVDTYDCQPGFTSLTCVGGMILEGKRIDGMIGATPLAIGASGLRIEGTNNTGIPFATTPTVAAGATVSVKDNPSICACQVSALKNALLTGGWNGTFEESGNGTAPRCAVKGGTCPGRDCP